MRLNILDRVSDPASASAPNEDAFGYTALSAWVLDGASGLGDEPLLERASDAAWLTSAYDAGMRARADYAECELQHLFESLIAEVHAEFESRRLRAPAGRFELPSAGMAFVRLRGTHLECARLGDCRALLVAPGSARVISTGGSRLLQQLDAEVVARMQALRQEDPSMSDEQIHAMVLSDLRANRSLLNRKDDYWVLGTDPIAARRMEIKTVPLGGPGPVIGLLVSDGFYRLVETFRAYSSDAALFGAALERGLASLLAELRGLEQADPKRIAHPRLKAKDDATALLFETVHAP
jgi:hypothetical protein